MGFVRVIGRVALLLQLLFAGAALLITAFGQAEDTLRLLQAVIPLLAWSLLPHVLLVLAGNGLFGLQRPDASLTTSIIALVALSLTVLIYGDVFFGIPLLSETLNGWLRPLPFWLMLLALLLSFALYRRAS